MNTVIENLCTKIEVLDIKKFGETKMVKCVFGDDIIVANMHIDQDLVIGVVEYLNELSERSKTNMAKNILNKLILTSYQFYMNNVFIDYSYYTKLYNIDKDSPVFIQ